MGKSGVHDNEKTIYNSTNASNNLDNKATLVVDIHAAKNHTNNAKNYALVGESGIHNDQQTGNSTDHNEKATLCNADAVS